MRKKEGEGIAMLNQWGRDCCKMGVGKGEKGWSFGGVRGGGGCGNQMGYTFR